LVVIPPELRLQIIHKGSTALAIIYLILSFPITATPLFSDINERAVIGIKGGSIMAEDPETGLSVGVYIPEGALQETTTITLVIHGSPLPRVLAKTYIKGISVLPEGLLLQEKARIDVYNPPQDVTRGMMLFRIVIPQFIIPLGSQVQHEDEGWVEGTFYITGKFSLGTPSPAEASAQCKKLAAYNPAHPLTHTGRAYSWPTIHLADNDGKYMAQADRGPCCKPYEYVSRAASPSDEEECMRWQKTLTKVEAHLAWVEYFILMGNISGEQTERRNAERALKEAIDDYLNKPAPQNKCGSYIKAAARYLESAQLLGIDEGYESRLSRHFEQLVDECSFVFTIETREWIDHPRERHDDGSTTEEKMNRYGIIKCHIPWNEFFVTGSMKVIGEGNMSLHHENHWIGGEENSHEQTNANWEIDKIEGSIRMNYDEDGVSHPEANITLYWKGEAQSRIWGKRHGNPTYDMSGTDDRSFTENKSYPIKNGYSEKIGDSTAGYSVMVYILKQPGDERDNPDDCF
jgi:hypothetical protein